MRDRMQEARQLVEEEKITKRELSYDMTRQYKTMQTQLESRIQFLESQVRKLQSELKGAQQELICVTAERDRLKREKEEEVASLNGKLHTMEKSYEAILQVCQGGGCTEVFVL